VTTTATTRTPTPLEQTAAAITDNIGKAIQGKPEAVRLALVCLLAEGHLLVEDAPGLGKTTLARALAASIDASWHRIQFTPDLLPADVTGSTVYHQRTETFEFHPGPVFAHVVLADEINRAAPKTQSALLEVMSERQITVEGVTHELPAPFIVVATQNPIEMEGTYRLPEAQLDRFMMRIQVGYPDLAAEGLILDHEGRVPTVRNLPAVVGREQVEAMVDEVAGMHVAPALRDYIISVAAATRDAAELRLGASPRASLALLRASRAYSAVAGRSYVTADDVKALAVPVLAHRLLLTPQAELAGQSAEQVVERVLAGVPVPSSLPA
jgi:MoxR-like ATPase